MREPGQEWRGELALLGVIAIWGCNFAVMKGAVDRVDPLFFNALRFTLSVLFVGVLHALEVRRRGGAFWPPRRLLWPIVGLGLAGHVGYLSGFMLGLERTTSGTSSLLVASSPIWTALVARATRVELLGRRAWLGLGVAFAGTATVAGGTGLEFGVEALEGNLLTVAAAISWGTYTALNRRFVGEGTSTSLAFWTMTSALPLLWLLGLPGLLHLDPGEVDAPLLGAALYAGLLGTGVAYVLWNVGIRRLGPARTASATSAVPIVAVLVGWGALDEPLGLLQLAGGGLVIAGLLLLGRRERRPRVAEAEGAA